MAFLRADAAKTMKSRTWSTHELTTGLTNLLEANSLDLPDDLSQLKDGLFLIRAIGKQHVFLVNVMIQPHNAAVFHLMVLHVGIDVNFQL